MDARNGAAKNVDEFVVGSIREYNEVVGSMFMPLTVSSRRSAFRARVRVAGNDSVYCFDIDASDHVVQRTEELIEQTTSGDFYKVSMQLRGMCTVLQDGREALLRAGDLAVYDTTRPYTLVMSEGARTAVLMLPRSFVTIPHDSVREVTATRFRGDEGVASMVSAFLSSVVCHLEEFATPAGHRLSRHIVDLVSTMLLGGFDHEEIATSRGALMPRVCEFIESRLADPELSLGSVAAAHFVSTRHLQALFQRERTTITTWIRERRLEMCRRDLSDPFLTGESVASIAARWGFAEPSHFSRAFKARFGCSPRAFREREEIAA